MLALAAHHAATPHHFFAISVSAACVCLTFALMLHWKPLQKVGFLTPWLVLVAGIGFAAAFLTKWAHSLSNFGSDLIPVIGSAVPVVVAAVLIYIVFYDMWPGHPSNITTEASALLLPAFAPEIGGAVGRLLATALSTIATAGAHIIGTAIGV